MGHRGDTGRRKAKKNVQSLESGLFKDSVCIKHGIRASW